VFVFVTTISVENRFLTDRNNSSREKARQTFFGGNMIAY